jgi:hypothetical protein
MVNMAQSFGMIIKKRKKEEKGAKNLSLRRNF